jgi:hypothetical protein
VRVLATQDAGKGSWNEHRDTPRQITKLRLQIHDAGVTERPTHLAILSLLSGRRL